MLKYIFSLVILAAFSVLFFGVEDVADTRFKELLETFENKAFICPFASFLGNVLDIIRA